MKAVIELDVPEWQIGQDVSVYFPDTMLKHGKCELLKEQKWIPVTERLPKSMINRVLVYVQHEDLTGYIGFGHFEKFKGKEMWYDLENDCQFSKRGYTVTHWMETPIPPMEGR